MSDLEKTVKIHLLKVVVLRDDPADKTDELVCILDHKIRYIDEPDPVVEIEHVLRAFMQIADIAGNDLNFGIDFLKQVSCLPFSFVADD